MSNSPRVVPPFDRWRKSCAGVLRAVFMTNGAFWFERDLRRTIPDAPPDIAVDIRFDTEAAIAWLREHGHDWMYVPQEIASCRKNGHSFACVLFEGRVIGYIKAGTGSVYISDYLHETPVEPGQVIFYDIYVAPEYRGYGIAPYLTREMMRLMVQRGFQRARLHIPSWNRASLRTAGKNGFRKVAYVRFIRIMGLRLFFRRPMTARTDPDGGSAA